MTKSVPILRPSRPSRASSTARLTTSSTVWRRSALQPVLSHTAPNVASSNFLRPFNSIQRVLTKGAGSLFPTVPSMPERLAALIRENQPCVVLTGAGASTESGIPDFRSPTGIWAEFDPLEYATLGAFERDPRKVWRFYAPRFDMLAAAEPNRVHVALAELEQGLVRAIVTQNIDTLHQRAGSQDVIEIHGSIRTSSCPSCASSYPLAEVVPLVEAGDGAPECPSCGAILKPDVVFFDELLPPGAMERATELAAGAGLLLVIGSGLEVYPVAGLPQVTLDAGGKVAVVNRTPTWADARAELIVRESAGAVLDAVASALRR